MPVRTFAFAACTALTLAASPALACKGSTLLFSDDFRQVDDSWGAEGDTVSVEDGRVKIKAATSAGYKLKYGGSLFEDADICATLRSPNDVKANTEPYAGLIFWAQDYSNFYVWQISAIGTASLWRQIKGKWVNVLDWRAVKGVKTGRGARNMLRVVTKGGAIDLYVNDEKVASVKGQMPEGGGEIGFFAVSEKAKRDAWKFSDLKVTKVE